MQIPTCHSWHVISSSPPLGLHELQGNLPTSLATLHRLTSLHFGSNQLSGILPRAFLVST